MLRPSAFPLALMLLAVPLTAAEPGLPAADGLVNACGSSDNENPCRMARVIRDTLLANGSTKTYRGEYVAVGTVVIENGSTAIFDTTHVTFTSTSNGVLVKDGGTLRILVSVFDEDTQSGSSYRVIAEDGALLEFTNSTLHQGEGMIVRTDATTLSHSIFEEIPQALRLEHVTLTVAQNVFLNNVIAVNETGGAPTLSNNRFEGGETCVRNWLSNPTIVDNVFRGCHTGILHQRSHSRFSGNDMSDDAFPPGTGMVIENTLSPLIENNRISNYGTGILVKNARAYIRNNSIHDNVGDGVRVESNSAEMDIQGNDITGNGAHGVRLVDATDVFLGDNRIAQNLGDGIRVEGASARVLLERNDVIENSNDGIVIASGGVSVAGGTLAQNGGDGIAVRGVGGVSLDAVEVLRNGANGVLIENAQASILRVNASENGESGFRYDPKGPLSLFGSTDLVAVRAMRNGISGLHNVIGNATFATDAWFEGNVHAGVDNDDLGSLIDVRNSYWGHPSGPRHPANPLGQGDRIEGGAVYHPYRDAPPA